MKERAIELDRLLAAWHAGDGGALDALIPFVYADLRRLAAQLLQRASGDDTLQPTALVNDVFVRLLGAAQLDIVSPKHFFATVARTMRHVLIDRARERQRLKRGCGDWQRVDLSHALDLPVESDAELPALDQALERLKEFDPRMATIVELRFFAGLEIEELAALLDLDGRTIYRELALAKGWLRRQLS